MRPWRVGIGTAGVMVDPDARLPKKELKLGKGTLTQLSSELSFFSPALLYLHDAFETDGPLFDFLAEYRQPVDFYHVKFNQRLFKGMQLPDGDRDWEHVLWAVATVHQRVLYDFLCSLCFVNPLTKRVLRVGMRHITIDDPLALESGILLQNRLPRLEVAVFGISANDRCIGVVPGAGPFGLPTVRFFPPDAKVIEYAKAVFKGDVSG